MSELLVTDGCCFKCPTQGGVFGFKKKHGDLSSVEYHDMAGVGGFESGDTYPDVDIYFTDTSLPALLKSLANFLRSTHGLSELDILNIISKEGGVAKWELPNE